MIYAGLMMQIVSMFFGVHFIFGFMGTAVLLVYIYSLWQHLISSTLDRHGATSGFHKWTSRLILTSGVFAVVIDVIYVVFFL